MDNEGGNDNAIIGGPRMGLIGAPQVVQPQTMVTTTIFSVWDGDWTLLEECDNTGARIEGYVEGYHGLVKTLVNSVYYYQDELGSTSHIADVHGALLEYYKYDLYGKPTYFNSASQQLTSSTYGVKDLFTGQRWIVEIGLYDDRNRFMSPDLGRFLQPDPIGFKGDASNLYRYCGNDWANRSDPMGTVSTSGDSTMDGTSDMKPVYTPPGDAQQKEEWLENRFEVSVFDHPGDVLSRDQIAQSKVAEAGKAGGLTMGQFSAVPNDSRLKMINQGISTLEANAQRIADQVPQYGSSAGEAAAALRAAYNDGRIREGNAGQFKGPINPFYPDSKHGTLYYNPQSPLKYFTVPRIAHEGQHLVDHGAGALFDRERRAYDLQYATGLTVGPYERRLNDTQVRQLMDDYGR